MRERSLSLRAHSAEWMPAQSPPSRLSRRVGKRLAVFGAAAAIAVVPALALAPAAFAADPFAVTTPSNGDTGVPFDGVPNRVDFAGTGLANGDYVQILFTGLSGPDQPAVYGDTDVDDAGNWSTTADFADLTPGQKQIVATVDEMAADGTTVVDSEVVTFTLQTAAVPLAPFAVTSPAVGSTVDTATPTFEGTGAPGLTVEIQYTGRAGHNDTAGKGIIKADGTFSIATDFSDYEPGGGTVATDAVRVLVYQTDAEGNELPGETRQAVTFYFSTPPVPLIPLSLTLAPTSETVSASSATGAALSATGFSPAEELTLTVTDPSGAPVTLGGTRPDQIFAAETDGSYADSLLLPSGAAAGDYTVTLTGVRTERTATATLTVTADPTPTPTPTPTTPAAAGGSSSGSGSSTTQLASTGLDGVGIGGLAGAFLLVGGSLFLLRRRSAKS
ncbi:hypothetical protein [Subtercola lobariae]|uniref:Gram-positive cocci surface proteins LPxTG domain-containing protein n=1 Tax=Subtercola lobariae TaxID=1588641 RepID=A0A917B870_9MICO|nr:hypothetical protein [Subtercola lobariae]GGF31007.1 hypothetical protein GCM10011399_25280 [Subtercola lobariae]